MELQEKNKQRENFWPQSCLQPVYSCGGLAACPVDRKMGTQPGEQGGMGAWLQLVEGLTGLTLAPTHNAPSPLSLPCRMFHQGSGWG